MMTSRYYAGTLVLFVVLGIALASETYMDYPDDAAARSAENIHELYKILLRHNALDNGGIAALPFEHLMIRKSQRSPSLRLRFGRSGPLVSAGVLRRSALDAANYEDN
ncbi:short neuropeptide F [Cephus cinctus]|uniref:Short neuropeptide F n=1 Tax=Cephus cinctus TaxID=211228 RepID=A0AAJ7BMP2_CEPCN|nr:short neuropeptide F [Cephus cinctus]XP_015589784.1 short neuropeptide F [Cephus cinctus]